MGDDSHLHKDAFAKIVQFLEYYLSLLKKKKWGATVWFLVITYIIVEKLEQRRA